MRLRVQDKIEAIRLRKLGYSYAEIQKTVFVSKGLLSGWFHGLEMSEEEIKLLDTGILKQRLLGRLHASQTNQQKKLDRDTVIFENARKSFETSKNEPFFLLGVGLYWAEGGKKVSCFQFINSDPAMIRLIVLWIERYLGYKKEDLKYRLFMHKVYADEACEMYWKDILSLDKSIFQKTIYKPTTHTVKKNPEYKGCLRVGFGGVSELRTVLAWQKLLIEYYR